MKKLLIVLLALSMVAGGFAANPIVDPSFVSVSGSASVTFGIDLETGKSGFDNAVAPSAAFSFTLNEAAAAASSSENPIWGEIEVSLGATSGSFGLPSASITKAQINFWDAYLGITSGSGFVYGGDFWAPNALNFANEKNPVGQTKTKDGFKDYKDGIYLGYGNEYFTAKLEARSKDDGGSKTDTADYKGELVGYFTKADVVVGKKADHVKYFECDTPDFKTGTTTELSPNADDEYKTTGGKYVFKVTYYTTDVDALGYKSGNYAMGLYTTIRPIKDFDLDFAFGGAFGLVGPEEKDINFFAGADVSVPVADRFNVVGCVAYSLYNDYKADIETWNMAQSELSAGLAFTWAESTGPSIIENMFAKELAYDPEDNAATSLSGVSFATKLDLLEEDMSFPIFAAVNFNGLVDGLSAAVAFSTKIIKDVDFACQIAAGASYAIKATDTIVVTPGAGMVLDIDTKENAETKQILPKVTLDVAGLIDNVSFNMTWAGAKYATAARDNGEMTFTTKISL